VAQVPRKRIAPLKVGAPGPSHLGTRETANPNWTTPEFLTFRLYLTVSQHRKRLGDELGVSLRIECEAFSIWR